MVTPEPQRGAEGQAKAGPWHDLPHLQGALPLPGTPVLGDSGTRFLTTATQSAPHPDFCSSLPKTAMLCSKVGARAPETIQGTEGFLLGGCQGEAWLKQKPLTGPLVPPRPPPPPKTEHKRTSMAQAPSQARSKRTDAPVPGWCPWAHRWDSLS